MTRRSTALETAWQEVSRITVPASAILPHQVIARTTTSLDFMMQEWPVVGFGPFGCPQVAISSGSRDPSGVVRRAESSNVHRTAKTRRDEWPCARKRPGADVVHV